MRVGARPRVWLARPGRLCMRRDPFPPCGRRRPRSAARPAFCRIVLVACAAIVWQIAPFARAQSPVAEASIPQPQCPPSATLAALPANAGSGRVSNPFTGEPLSTPLGLCVLRFKPQGDCPAGSAALSVPGVAGSVCVMPAACPAGYALTSTWCCPASQATTQGLCCPPGQSPQANGLCSRAP